MKSTLVYIWSIALLALFAGGSITILFVLIPFWQSLQPEAVMEWFRNFGTRVGITMLPMQLIPLFMSVYAYFLAKKLKEEGKNLWIWAIVSHIIILIMLFAYYLPVNFSFVNKTMDPTNVPSELIRWEIIHIARTILSVLSTVLAILACSSHLKNYIR